MSQDVKSDNFFKHLTELRSSLLRSLVILILGFGVCIYWSKDIFDFLSLPLKRVLPEDSHFISTHPFEAWITYLKTALFSGLFISLPFIFWQVWHFVSPGLHLKEKRFTLLFVILTTLFFMSGGLFGYFYVFPHAFEFFTGILQDTNIVFLPQMKDYLNFTFRLLIAFGIIFELPILLLVITALNLVSFSKLVSFQKYMIVVAFVISAMLTPPDVITQTLMALPIILLYEIGLLLSWFIKRKEK